MADATFLKTLALLEKSAAVAPVLEKLSWNPYGPNPSAMGSLRKTLGTLGNKALEAGAGALGGGLVTGTAIYGINKLMDHLSGAPGDAAKARAVELSRMQGRQEFAEQQRAVLGPLHQQMIPRLMQDEMIAGADPNVVQNAYQTMVRFAPNLASDPSAATTFVREHVLHGAVPHYSTIKNLADAEKAVAAAGGAGV